MTVLQIHKFYWPRDGASRYMFQLSDLLKGAGHTVIPFSMQHPENVSSPYERFFVSELNLSEPSRLSFSQKLAAAGRIVYSFEAKRKIELLLNEEGIDVAHLHNIYHHISPSILGELKKRGIPIVMTLHDYKLLSPNYTMFHHGHVHENDAEGWYFNCIKNQCMRESVSQSVVATAEMIFHHKIMRFFERYVDRFIAPSNFIKKMCHDYGWPEEKFVHIPHPVELPHSSLYSDRGYVAYVGRLSEEKGLRELLVAAKMTPDIPYRIVGQGPLGEMLTVQAHDMRIHNVQFEGFLTGSALDDVIAQARIIVVPSLWYENYPLSILEAKAAGKIVIASNIGGTPEMLPKSLLVYPGDPEKLAEKINEWYHAEPRKRKLMGEQLRAEAEHINDPSKHLKAVEGVYEELTRG